MLASKRHPARTGRPRPLLGHRTARLSFNLWTGAAPYSPARAWREMRAFSGFASPRTWALVENRRPANAAGERGDDGCVASRRQRACVFAAGTRESMLPYFSTSERVVY